MKCQLQSRTICFSVNVYILRIVIRRQFQSKLLGFFNFVGKIQQLLYKRAQKNNLGRGCELYFTSYLFSGLSKILSHPKAVKNTKKTIKTETIKNTKTCWNLGKSNLVGYLITHKLIFFKTLIISLEPTL